MWCAADTAFQGASNSSCSSSAAVRGGTIEAGDQRSDHMAIAVVSQHILARLCFGDMLSGLDQIAQAQVDVAQVGVKRRIECADPIVVHAVGGAQRAQMPVELCLGLDLRVRHEVRDDASLILVRKARGVRPEILVDGLGAIAIALDHQGLGLADAVYQPPSACAVADARGMEVDTPDLLRQVAAAQRLLHGGAVPRAAQHQP